MRLTYSDFIRLRAGELSSFDLALGEQLEVVGDVIVALRLPDMFGVIGQPG